MATTGTAEKTVVITRLIDVPREKVFRAWAEPEQMKQWWGPRDITMPFCEIDFRVGGTAHSCMRSPEGQDFCFKGVYREIVEPERIVVTDSFVDEEGNVVPASHYGMSDAIDLEMLITATFEEQDGKTKLTVEHLGFPEGEDREGAIQGWTETLERLEECLVTKQ